MLQLNGPPAHMVCTDVMRDPDWWDAHSRTGATETPGGFDRVWNSAATKVHHSTTWERLWPTISGLNGPSLSMRKAHCVDANEQQPDNCDAAAATEMQLSTLMLTGVEEQ